MILHPPPNAAAVDEGSCVSRPEIAKASFSYLFSSAALALVALPSYGSCSQRCSCHFMTTFLSARLLAGHSSSFTSEDCECNLKDRFLAPPKSSLGGSSPCQKSKHDLRFARGTRRRTTDFQRNKWKFSLPAWALHATIDYQTHNLLLSRQSWAERLEKTCKRCANDSQKNYSLVDVLPRFLISS